MILDKLANIGAYRGLHPNLDTAIDHLLNNDVYALPLGRTEVDQDRVFINVMESALQQNRTWERHRQYADIQIMLGPGESIAWAPAGDLTGFDPYDEQRGDVQLSQDTREGVMCFLPTGCFGLYLPEDAHRPSIGTGLNRKAVVKVKVC
ncbi:MAG: DUF386 domain-containing protein [Clostridiales bacterium]|nr:DUF386 domain-containing protein [Clostridiales bacterium]